MKLNSPIAKISYAAAGLIAGAVLATTLGAQAATVSPSTSTTASSTAAAADPHPGDNGADGVAEANEVHGAGHGGALNLSGTVTAVGASSVTIKTSTATTTYSVTSASDIDKNGEATVSALMVGDKVTFSVDSANAKQIDKLHTGDETKNLPTGTAPSSTSSNAG